MVGAGHCVCIKMNQHKGSIGVLLRRGTGAWWLWLLAVASWSDVGATDRQPGTTGQLIYQTQLFSAKNRAKVSSEKGDHAHGAASRNKGSRGITLDDLQHAKNQAKPLSAAPTADSGVADRTTTTTDQPRTDSRIQFISAENRSKVASKKDARDHAVNSRNIDTRGVTLAELMHERVPQEKQIQLGSWKVRRLDEGEVSQKKDTRKDARPLLIERAQPIGAVEAQAPMSQSVWNSALAIDTSAAKNKQPNAGIEESSTKNKKSKAKSKKSEPENQKMVTLERVVTQSQFGALGPPMTLAEAVKQALERHPRVAQARSAVEERRFQVDAAKAGYYPKINAEITGGLQRSGGGIGDEQRAQLSASQMLYDFGKVSSEVAKARAGLDLEMAEQDAALDDIAKEVADVFVDVQRNSNLMVFAEEQVDRLQALSDLAKTRYSAGASTRSDYEQTVTRLEAARLTEMELSAQLDRSRALLSALLGETRQVDVSEDFPDARLESECLVVNADKVDSSPQVSAAIARYNEAEAGLKQAKARALPTLSLEPYISRRISDDRLSNVGKVDSGVFLKMSVPLYQGGASTAERRAAKAAANGAKTGVDAMRLTAKQEVLKAKSAISGVRASKSSHAARMAAIDLTGDLYKKQYLQLGVRSLLDLLNAEQERYMARTAQRNAEFDLRKLDVACLYHVGRLRPAILDNDMRQKRSK